MVAKKTEMCGQWLACVLQSDSETDKQEERVFDGFCLPNIDLWMNVLYFSVSSIVGGWRIAMSLCLVA